MPTGEQLNEIWETNFEFGLNNNDNPEFIPPVPSTGFTGKRIGIIIYDDKSKDLKIVPDSPSQKIPET